MIYWYHKEREEHKMKITKLVEFKNENGKTIYYKKMNGHKLTPHQLTYNQITKGLNYEVALTVTI